MKTLEEHNKSVNKIRDENKIRSGVKCDKCETEMALENPYHVLASCPPQQTVVCPKCGYRGYKIG